MIVSIHQPNYLPWLGFFHKILQSDIYVVFDDVQLPRGKDYIVRNCIKTQGGTKWLRVSVKEKSGMLPISQVEINNDTGWNVNHWNSIRQNYAKSRFFVDYQEQFKKIFDKKWTLLVDLNVTLIKMLMEILDIKTKVIKSSELGILSSGTDKILQTVEMLGGDHYLTGWGEGSRRYIEGKEELFKNKGIEVIHQEFNHPVYPQLFGDFISNLSICDMLFNVGAKKTIEGLVSK
jgi:hypothetical protein